jgi:hypothetical protein
MNNPGTDGDRRTRTDGHGDPQPTPFRGTTIITLTKKFILHYMSVTWHYTPQHPGGFADAELQSRWAGRPAAGPCRASESSAVESPPAPAAGRRQRRPRISSWRPKIIDGIGTPGRLPLPRPGPGWPGHGAGADSDWSAWQNRRLNRTTAMTAVNTEGRSLRATASAGQPRLTGIYEPACRPGPGPAT